MWMVNTKLQKFWYCTNLVESKRLFSISCLFNLVRELKNLSFLFTLLQSTREWIFCVNVFTKQNTLISEHTTLLPNKNNFTLTRIPSKRNVWLWFDHWWCQHGHHNFQTTVLIYYEFWQDHNPRVNSWPKLLQDYYSVTNYAKKKSVL